MKDMISFWNGEGNMVHVWYRKGAAQEITKDEFMTLLNNSCPGGIVDRDSYDFSKETEDEIMHKFDSDGDGYIPGEVMEDLARQNGIKLRKGCKNMKCR